jgi:hypothetical protein
MTMELRDGRIDNLVREAPHYSLERARDTMALAPGAPTEEMLGAIEREIGVAEGDADWND